MSRSHLRAIEICDRPVFVIGCPRSGTSVVAWALAAVDDEFWTFPETDFFYYLFATDPAGKAWREVHARPDHRSWLVEYAVQEREFTESVGLGLNALITSRQPGKRWIDQTPTYTLIAGTLARMYSEASFVNVLRDGRRVVHSMLNFMRGKSEEFQQGFADLTWATDFREACQTWALYVKEGGRTSRAYPARTTTILNEEILTDPEAAFSRTLRDIGSEPNSAPAAFTRTERINSSVGASASPEPWESWDEERRAVFIEAARGALDLYSDDVRERVRALWPDFDAWYAVAPQSPQVTADAE